MSIELLRLYVADPAGEQEFLHDDQLQTLLDNHDDDVYAAATDAWRMKAADVSAWYRVILDGVFLSREQVFDHCIKMAEHFERLGGGNIVSIEMDSGFQVSSSPAEF